MDMAMINNKMYYYIMETLEARAHDITMGIVKDKRNKIHGGYSSWEPHQTLKERSHP